MKKNLSRLFPYKNYYYEFNCDEISFLKKLNEFIVIENTINYTPGRHYINYDPEKQTFSFSRKKLNPGSGSGGVFRYKYKYHNNKLYVRCRMGYSLTLYVIFIFSCIVTFMVAYIPVNLVFQMEAFIVRDDFEKYFKEEILSRTYDSVVKF